MFEGRDTAGKGGTIKAITQRVSPRTFRVVALPAPTERERSQMYVQRYVPHFPAAGEVVIFDRSWYNRAGIERVMGFCTDEQAQRFLDLVPGFEKAMVDAGILLIKYWLEVSPEEQVRRLTNRIDDPRKVWKLSGMDLKSYGRWDDYTVAPRRHVRRDGHRVGAMVGGAHGRQAARPPQRDLAPARPDPLRAARPTRGQAPEADDQLAGDRGRVAGALRARAILSGAREALAGADGVRTGRSRPWRCPGRVRAGSRPVDAPGDEERDSADDQPEPHPGEDVERVVHAEEHPRPADERRVGERDERAAAREVGDRRDGHGERDGRVARREAAAVRRLLAQDRPRDRPRTAEGGPRWTWPDARTSQASAARTAAERDRPQGPGAHHAVGAARRAPRSRCRAAGTAWTAA